MLTHPSLRQFQDKIMLITRGTLFSKERLKTILNMNLHKYDYLIDDYMHDIHDFKESKSIYTSDLNWSKESSAYNLKSKGAYTESFSLQKDTGLTGIRLRAITWNKKYDGFNLNIVIANTNGSISYHLYHPLNDLANNDISVIHIKKLLLQKGDWHITFSLDESTDEDFALAINNKKAAIELLGLENEEDID